jgi:hypothetical protein
MAYGEKWLNLGNCICRHPGTATLTNIYVRYCKPVTCKKIKVDWVGDYLGDILFDFRVFMDSTVKY